MFSLWIFPQDGGLSAPQRSRVGSLQPISTHTVVHGMIWNLAPLKPERVSYCKLSWLCYTYPNTASHILLNSHTQIPPMFSVLRLWSVTKWIKRAYFQTAGPRICLASGRSEHLSLYACHHKQSIDSVLCKQQREVPGETRAQTLQWCAVHNNALSTRDAVQ